MPILGPAHFADVGNYLQNSNSLLHVQKMLGGRLFDLQARSQLKASDCSAFSGGGPF